MISEEKVDDDLKWKKELYKLEKKSLEQDETVESHIPSAYNTMAGTSIDRGIDELLLERQREKTVVWIHRGTEHYLELMNKIDEYEDFIEGSWIAHKPLKSIKMLYAAVLSESAELIKKSAQKTLETEETHPEKYPEWSSHYFYSKALANFLLGDEKETEKFWEKLKADRYTENFKQSFQAREKFLTGILYNESEEILQSINKILKYHHKEYGKDASTATDFISIEATAYAKIAGENGIEIDLEKIDSNYRDYLMEELL